MTQPELCPRDILLVCTFCGGVRLDDGSWAFLEAHDRETTEAELSHGICPPCRISHYVRVCGPARE